MTAPPTTYVYCTFPELAHILAEGGWDGALPGLGARLRAFLAHPAAVEAGRELLLRRRRAVGDFETQQNLAEFTESAGVLLAATTVAYSVYRPGTADAAVLYFVNDSTVVELLLFADTAALTVHPAAATAALLRRHLSSDAVETALVRHSADGPEATLIHRGGTAVLVGPGNGARGDTAGATARGETEVRALLDTFTATGPQGERHA